MLAKFLEICGYVTAGFLLASIVLLFIMAILSVV